MIGTMIGDASGDDIEVREIKALKKEIKPVTYEERTSILNDNEPLLKPDSSYTDDTTLTVGVADALIHGSADFEYYLKKYGLEELNKGFDKYGRSRFSKGFSSWLKGESDGNSYGNGAAMRISPVGYFFDNINDVIEYARLATIPSHNTEEAINGATAVAITNYLARHKENKASIKRFIESIYNYDMSFDLEKLQRNYKFSARMNETVPQALFCFFESNSFEDAIRKTLSIGGDADTNAAIVGAIAEAYYGIGTSKGIAYNLIEQISLILPNNFIDVTNQFYGKIGSKVKVVRRK